MTVDPHSDAASPTPGSDEESIEEARLREAQELEERMRRALATKEDPLRDSETTSERLRRLEREHAEGGAGGEGTES